VSKKTRKFIILLSTACPILLSIVSFETYLLGAIVTITDKEKCSKTTVPVGEKCTHGKHKSAQAKKSHKTRSR